jgi:hypothetical protein
VPLIAISFLGYTIWKNIDGAVFPYDRFPLVVGIWLLVGIAITLVFPKLTRRIGVAMAREEGVAEGEVA